METSGVRYASLIKWSAVFGIGFMLLAFAYEGQKPATPQNPKAVAVMPSDELREATGMNLPEAYQPNHNGILRLYNLFPRNYTSIDAMTDDLQRIRDMGFSHVWLNPLHLTTGVEKKDWPEGTPNGLKGSIYSMRDPFFFNPDFSVVKGEARDGLSDEEIFEKDKAALKRFTAKARELSMVPMFDLVLSHIAPDSAIVDGTHPKFSHVDTHPWVERYENGKPKRHGLDQDGNILPEVKYPDKEVWDDVVMLQYNDPQIRQSIIDHLWKPFVEMYFEMGFMGIRVDSVANNHPDVMEAVLSHFRLLHEEQYGVEPTILGESLGGTIAKQANINPHATHLYNSAYWLPNLTGPNMSADGKSARETWANPQNWFLHEMGEKQGIVFVDHDTGTKIEGRKGGSIGYAGSHDELPWILQFPGILPPMPPEMADAKLFRAPCADFKILLEDAERGLREKIAVAALASDAGWFLTSFDERLDTTLRSVFDKQRKGIKLGNIEPFVKGLNQILAAMPETQLGSWSKRFFYDEQPDLVIIERHTGFGHDGPANLVMVNMSPEKEITLSAKDRVAIASLTGRNLADFQAEGEEKSVWLGSGVHFAEPKSFVDRIGERLDAAHDMVRRS